MIRLKYFLSFFIGTLVYTGIFAQVDTPPSPYGGSSLMKEFICNEMIYPPEAMKDKIQGTVEVTITVMQDGKALNHHVTGSVYPDLDAEALRISKLLLFYPAVKNGSYIIENITIPVKFNVKKYKRNCKNKGLDDFEQYSGPADSSLKVYPTGSVDRAPRPVFKDPAMNFGKYISQNLKYPDIAYKQSITGDVELSFVVETSGRISNIEVVNPLGGGCTEEAISLINQLLWSPGMYKGMAVRTSLSARISFNLENNSNHQYLPNNTNTTM
ncbi:MAG: energy transducer TonB [Bacteroidales bacterium]|jgi:TonB family protein|nr:energy transducer TonB [Bacteroidales bacterium]